MTNLTPVQINDVTLRDGPQSKLRTRYTNRHALIVAPYIDAAGFNMVQVFGGALPDAALQFLNENPFQNLRNIRREMQKTRISMLLRGQNGVGYRNYHNDFIEDNIAYTAEQGMNVFTIFDGLNFVANQRSSIEAVTAAKMRGYKVEAQGVICIARNPVQCIDNDINRPNPEYYAAKARELTLLGADSIYLKDMSGIATPKAVEEIVKAVKSATNLPITFHAHSSMGRADAANIAAIRAGVDAIDTAIFGMSGGTGHSDIRTILDMIDRSNDPVLKARRPVLNMEAIDQASRLLMAQRRYYDHVDSAYKPSIQQIVIASEVPGGMLTNLEGQVHEMIKGTPFSFEQVYPLALREVPIVAAEAGWPQLVTPFSQIVGGQSVNNVISTLGGAKRHDDQGNPVYALMIAEMRELLVGKYGPTPVAPHPGLVEVALRKSKMTEVMTSRPADLLAPELPKFTQQLIDAGIEEPTREQVLLHGTSKAGLKFILNDGTNPSTSSSLPQQFATSATANGGKFIGDHLHASAATLEAIVQSALERTYIKTGFYQYLDQTELDAREAACLAREAALKKQLVLDMVDAGIQPVQVEMLFKIHSKGLKQNVKVNGHADNVAGYIGGVVSPNDYINYRAKKLGVSEALIPTVGPELVAPMFKDRPANGQKLTERRPQNPAYTWEPPDTAELSP